MLCALIMAGGKGERLWPVSTEELPKQFLNLVGHESMIQASVKRLNKFIDIDKIFIVTAERYKDLIISHIPEMREENIILEPKARNTAACITLSTFIIKERFKNTNIVVLPSDHLILDDDKFISAIQRAEEVINIDRKGIVTIGIEPTRPDTGYGYIKFGENISKNLNRVDSFKEKPTRSIAKKYIKERKYLWNSGMYIVNSNRILECIKIYLPNTFELLNSLDYKNLNYEKLEVLYNLVESISIDYGVMEKSDSLYVVKGEFHWDDLGSWNSVYRYKNKDINDNIIDGSVIAISCKNNIIQTKKKTYVMGINDLLIVETDKEIMILKREDISKIKELKDYVQKEYIG